MPRLRHWACWRPYGLVAWAGAWHALSRAGATARICSDALRVEPGGLALLCDRTTAASFLSKGQSAAGAPPCASIPQAVRARKRRRSPSGSAVLTALPQFMDEALLLHQRPLRARHWRRRHGRSLLGFDRSNELFERLARGALYSPRMLDVYTGHRTDKLAPLPIGLDSLQAPSVTARKRAPLARDARPRKQAEPGSATQERAAQRAAIAAGACGFFTSQQAQTASLGATTAPRCNALSRATRIVQFQTTQGGAAHRPVARKNALRARGQPARERPRLPPNLGVPGPGQHRDHEALLARLL